MKFYILYLSLFSLFCFPVFNWEGELSLQKDYKKIEAVKNVLSQAYADSVLKTLTTEQKIAQLIMIDVYPKKDEAYYKTIDTWVKEKKVGGLILFRGSPSEMAYLSNRYRNQAQIPLWVAIDGEWGISMRADSVLPLPKALTLGAISDNQLIRRYGQMVGMQCRRIGVNMNMAPVADVNSNPKNPVINYRSFGEDRLNVTLKSIAYYMGMNETGVVSVTKHFPGHGNTSEDSHFQLPVVNDTYSYIDSVHLFPFKELIHLGIPAVMVAHLYASALDTTTNQPSSLSPSIINKLLVDSLRFKGLIMTDALGMKGVSSGFKPGEIEVKALIAGNDMLIMPQEPQKAIEAVLSAISEGRISMTEIDEKCRKVLKFKYRYLFEENKVKVNISDIPRELNDTLTTNFIYEVFSNAVTLLLNRNHFYPLNQNRDKSLAVLEIGNKGNTYFTDNLSKYIPFSKFFLDIEANEADISKTISLLQKFDKIIITITGMNQSVKKNFGLNNNIIDLLSKLRNEQKTSLILFGNPYSLNLIEKNQNYASIVVAYEETPEAMRFVADAISGRYDFLGKLPVSVTGFKSGSGIVHGYSSTLEYVLPQDLNINTDALRSIDAIVNDAITKKAFPGCQILLAQDGKVFYHKAYGSKIYENDTPVDLSDLYDLASLTKVLSTTLAVMKLFDEHKISLTEQVGTYLNTFKGTEIEKIQINELLTHQSGLVSWIPFYKEVIKNDTVKQRYLSKLKSEIFSIQVADSLYLNKEFKDTIFNIIARKPLGAKKYLYSDLGFYILKEIVEKITGMTIDAYVEKNFYQPMGLRALLFNPLRYYEKEKIMPTELDNEFRKQLIQGYVHDQGAALFGGVGGHAGLFGNASDVACVFQMLLEHGKFNNQRFIDSLTVELFTMKIFPNNRRGLGFDKPLNQKENPNCADEASPKSYGHSGFTGTYVWADPANKLLVVFLSNRVYPYANNKKINELDIRKKIHQQAYKAVQSK